MIENINQLVERDGKIELLEDKALNLSVVSAGFRKSTKKLKNQEKRKRIIQGVVVALVVLSLIGLIVLVA